MLGAGTDHRPRRALAAIVVSLLAAGVVRAGSWSPAAAATVDVPSATAADHVACEVVTVTPPGEPPLEAEVCSRRAPRDGVGVLLIHGGGGFLGDRTTVGPWVQRLVDAGYLTVAVDYRLFSPSAPGPVYPRQERDVKHAVRWLRANSERLGVRPGGIVAFGFSHGAALAATLLVTPDDPRFGPVSVSDRVDGLVGMYGYYDGFSLYPDAYFGGDEGLRGAARPVERAAAATGPALLVHGAIDDVVPSTQSEGFDNALDRAGVPADLRITDGMGHCFDHDPSGLTPAGHVVAWTVVDWLDRRF